MSKKRFSAEVLKLVPEFASFDNTYFYETPFDHVLCGFVYERTPGAAYVWKWLFPLYDRFNFLHLSFGDRLPPGQDYLEITLGGPKEQATAFVERIQPYRDQVAALRDIGRFAEYLETKYVATGIAANNHNHRRCYAVTLIMLGQAEEAARELESLLKMEGIARDPAALKDMQRLRDDLARGLSTAKRTLEVWEIETKLKLGLAEG